jgi:O-succinylbenzoate synthase
MTPITCIEVYRVAMPLVYPFRTAFGNDDTIESILVRIEADGLSGWGEATPWRYPAYSAEAAATTFVMVRDFLAPLVLGRTIESGAGLQALLAGVKGNPFAKAALDLAWWDLSAKSRGKPLWQVLGGTGPVVDVGADFGVMESIDALLATVAGAVAAGYKRVKLKYRPGWELDMVRAVRQAFPTTTIHVDCNSAYTWRDTEMFRKLDAFELAMIEQPLAHDDLIDHAELQKQLQTPICLDESITSPDKARKAIKIGACKWVNIKPGRVGGLSQAVQIHDLCRNAGIPCWVGGMLESAVGAAHCLALATLANMKYPADIFPSARFYKRDLSTPEIVHSGPSQVTASPRPGVGTAPDPELLARCRIESALLRP